MNELVEIKMVSGMLKIDRNKFNIIRSRSLLWTGMQNSNIERSARNTQKNLNIK